MQLSEQFTKIIDDTKQHLLSIIYIAPPASQSDDQLSKKKEAIQKSETVHIKKVIYTIGFVLLCFIDQLSSTTPEYIHNVTTPCTGIIISIIAMTAFPLQSYLRIPYFIWSLFAYISFHIFQDQLTGIKLPGEIIVIGLNYWLIGLITLRLLFHYIYEHNWKGINWVLFAAWIFVMLGLIRSDNDSFWPVWFLFLFGCFYLAPFSKEESDALYNGITNGILIGFALIQGFCFCFRLYDVDRYDGLYLNSNMNAIFYVMVQAALLGKWYQLSKRNTPIIHKLLCLSLNALLCNLLIMTGCRSAFLAIIVSTLLFLFMMLFVEHSFRFAKGLGRILLLSCSIALFMPFVFAINRFMPAQYKNPVLLFSNSENEKIHEEVSIDNEKYMTYENVIELINERICDTVDSLRIENGRENNIFDKLKRYLPKVSLLSDIKMSKVYAATPNDSVTPKINDAIIYGSGKSKNDPWIANWKSIQSLDNRTLIWKYYYHNLNENGHTNKETSFWLNNSLEVTHAHNIILQFAFIFGKKAGFLFFIFIAFVYSVYFIDFLSKRNDYVLSILFITSVFVFGMTELNWQLGQLSFVMLFESIKLIFGFKTSDKIMQR